jgi:hypothetical protein
MIMHYDMPKIESPFVRKVNKKGQYVVTPEIAEGYDWVFKDETVRAVEKLHGTNVSVIVENGAIQSVWNRTERIPFFNKGKRHIIEGLLESYERGYLELPDGLWFGELIGKKVNGNPYQIDGNLWIPFKTYSWDKLSYKSWGKYPKDFETISNWFKELMPLFSLRVHGKEFKTPFVEGIVFTHPSGKMAKLRVDMFPFWYELHPNAKSHKEGETA